MARGALTDEWTGFPALPGKHLRWDREKSKHFRLLDADGQAHAHFQTGAPYLCLRRMTVDGREFEVTTDKGPWTGLYSPWLHQTRQLCEVGSELPVLWTTGVHFKRDAGTTVHLTDTRSFTFPVDGTRSSRAVMRAVDESGQDVLWFRKARFPGKFLAGPLYEIVVAPQYEVTTNLLCVAVLASDLLRDFFDNGTGG